MGKVREADLWRLFETQEVGSLENTGSAQARWRPTATAIRKAENGYWVYTPQEVELGCWPLRFLELPLGEGRLMWMGMEVQTTDKEWSRKQLTFALKPYSLNWYGSAALRPAAKQKADVTRAIQKLLDLGHSMVEAMDLIAYDPFETNRAWITARIRSPRRAHWEEASQEGGAEGFAYRKNQNYSFGAKGSAHSPQWMFGVCEDFEQARADLRVELLGSPKYARKMLTNPEALVEEKLACSIRQALGGVEGTQRDRRAADKAFDIYQAHMEASAAGVDPLDLAKRSRHGSKRNFKGKVDSKSISGLGDSVGGALFHHLRPCSGGHEEGDEALD